MKWSRFAVILVVMPLCAAPAPAGLFFNRHKPNEGEKLGHLLSTARSDRSDRRRASALEDLRGFDANAHPEIVVVLIDRLQNDPSALVRQEAAEGLARLRVVSPEAGQALQQAEANDASRSVRREAKKALAQHPGTGYGPPKLVAQPVPSARPEEPPVAAESAPVVKTTPRPIRPVAPPAAAPPAAAPVADGPVLVEQPTAIPVARPLPQGPRQQPAAGPALVPAETPRLVKPPSAAPSDGPELKDPF
jgi:HEAT repeats